VILPKIEHRPWIIQHKAAIDFFAGRAGHRPKDFEGRSADRAASATLRQGFPHERRAKDESQGEDG
jgi:hypothetical protein